MSACPVNEWEQGFFDRQRDIIDAYALGDITREEFLREIKNINVDYYEASWMADQIKQQAAE